MPDIWKTAFLYHCIKRVIQKNYLIINQNFVVNTTEPVEGTLGFAKVLLHLDFHIQIMLGTSFWVELNKFGYTMIY